VVNKQIFTLYCWFWYCIYCNTISKPTYIFPFILYCKCCWFN